MREDNPSADKSQTATSHEDEIREASDRPADSGDDVGPSAQR
ncbi:hypothetical protein ACN27E_04575 [Mycobacterium sp. WMMD1722]